MVSLFDNYTEDEIYDAFKFAETGSFNNPWIRTVARKTPGGSTAFGPVQITGSLLDLYKNNRPEIWSKHLDIGPTLLQQAGWFSKYGNEPDLSGYKNIWDYGGTGFGLSDKEKGSYKDLAQDMMKDIWKEKKNKKNSVEEFIQSWRGKSKDEDPDYYKRFNKY